MPVTLAQAKLNTTDDVDVFVIDEFAKNNFLLQTLTFDDVVSGAGNGATLSYGYTRLITQRTAAFRAINSEYVPTEVTKQRFSVDLKPLGGSFQIDRVLKRVARGAEIELQMQQLIKASAAKFNDEVINGDVAVDSNGFDGLSKSLTGSVTEFRATASTDWRGATIGADAGKANDALDALDEWLSLMDGVDAILGNKDGLARIRSLARRAGFYDRSQSAFGTEIESYRGIALVDLGEKPGSSNLVIPTTSKTVATVAGNYTDIYAVRFGLDGFHGVSMGDGQPLVSSWLPDFTTSGAVKTGEAELGPAAVVLKRTKAAGVFRNILVR